MPEPPNDSGIFYHIALSDILQNLTERGMDMDDVAEFGEGCVAVHQRGDFLHKVGGVCSEDVAADDAVAGVGEELHDALGGVDGECLAVGAIVALVAGVFAPFVFQQVFGGAYAGGLGTGEDGGGHDVEANLVGATENRVYHANALHRGGVGKQLPAIDVADGEDAALAACLLDDLEGVGIDLDAETVGFDAGAVEIEVLDVRRATRCDENHIGLDAFLLAFAFEGDNLSVNLLHAGAEIELHTALFELFAQSLGDVAIDGGQTFLEVFDNGYFAAETGENAGKFHADDTCANDAKTFRNLLDVKQFGRGDAIRPRDARDGQDFRARARGDDDVVGLKLLHEGFRLAATFGIDGRDNLDGVGILEMAVAVYEGDAGLLHERFHARAQLLHNLLFALHDLREIDRSSELGEFGIVAECLRGNASAVQAGAACERTLNDDHLQPVLGCIFGCAIASGAAADDN